MGTPLFISRAATSNSNTPTRKVYDWLTHDQFNLVLDDTDVLQSHLLAWKTADATQELPPTLCIEVYLDLSELNNKQALVITDSEGKRYDVAETMAQQTDLSDRSSTRKPLQVVLERWSVEIKGDGVSLTDARDPLPNVYKKAVVLFRSLYTFTRFMPAWKYYRRIQKQPPNQPALKLNYRITSEEFKHPRKDNLNTRLFSSPDPVTETHTFAPSPSPVGPLCVSVTYRTNCDFRVDDAESLLSSHFMGLDDRYFKPTLGSAGNDGGVPGSLPVKSTNQLDEPDRSQAYGSLSTFHQVGPATGSSPISALRAMKDITQQSPSDTDSLPSKLPPTPRTATNSKSALRTGEGSAAFQRRTSVSFQPFKAGSLSSSPALSGANIPFASPSSSLGRPSSLNPLLQPRNRTSLTALPQTALRQPSLPNETAIASSASSSPKPAPINRYSSSFGHRRGKFSSGGASKTEDDNTSSGKASLTSSVQPGSGVLNEQEGPTSSGSLQTDDENISDFLKLLEQKKDLKSLNRRDSASRDASMRRTTAALSKYSRMRETNQALSDSMSSSLLLHRSSSSSSRHLSSVPPMVHGTSVSTSSSPGKPISPHTPHTPAIPSRLSANSIIEYDPPRQSNRGRTPRGENQESHPEEPEPSDAPSTAIDIPTSPRAWPFVRRSSSASQQQRIIDEEPDLFGLRSASLPTDERPDLSLSELLQIQDPSAGSSTQVPVTGDMTVDEEPSCSQPPDNLLSEPESREDTQRPGPRVNEDNATDPNLPFLNRFPSRDVGAARRQGVSSNHGSFTNLARGMANATAQPSSAPGGERRSRYSFRTATAAATTTSVDDDEPLLFTMSEIGAQSRRSIEEGRGGSNAGSGSGRGQTWR